MRAGARQIQGTLNGLGERCGNANLVSLIPTLALKPDFAERFETGVTREALARDHRNLAHASTNCSTARPNRHAPYVGASAFATKAGIHASALAKDPRTYEHVPPESVGNARAILVSDQAGKLQPDRRTRPPRRRRSARTTRRLSLSARGREGARGRGLRL